VAGVVGAAGLIFLLVDEVTSGGLTHFTTDAPLEIDLPAGAERTIYRDRADLSPRVSCKVEEAGTARPVPVRSATGFTLTIGDEELSSISSFEADEAGRYLVTCSSQSARPVEVVVGPRIRVFRSLGRVFSAGAIVLVALCLSAAIIAVTAVKRHQRRSSPFSGP
jgi:hypothetical protein